MLNQYRGLLKDSIFLRRFTAALTAGGMLAHLRSLGVTSMNSSLKTLEPLIFMPKAALKLCCLLSLFVFEAELRIDGCIVAESPVDGEAVKRSGSKVVEDRFARFCLMSAVPLFKSLLGCTLDLGFLFYTGPVLAFVMRSVRTEA